MHEIVCFLLVLKFSDFFNTKWIFYKFLGQILQEIHINYKKSSKNIKFLEHVQMTMENHMIYFCRIFEF